MFDLSIIIPAYNEEKRLPKTLQSTFDYLAKKKLNYEIIVVDDGSQDQTPRVVKHLAISFENLRLISYPQNQGKGFAVKRGVREARGKFILMMDADFSIPITELAKLWLYRNDFALVIGSRFLRKGPTSMKNKWRYIISRTGNFLTRMVLDLNISDTQCGFKLFQKEAARRLFSDLVSLRFGFDIEILVKAKTSDMLIKEVSIFWQEAAGSKVRAVRSVLFTLWEFLLIKRNLKNLVK